MLARNGVGADGSGSLDNAKKKISGKISTIISAVVEGNSHFYVSIEGEDTIFDFKLPSMLSIVTCSKGDEITFEYIDADGVGIVDTILEAKKLSQEPEPVA